MLLRAGAPPGAIIRRGTHAWPIKSRPTATLSAPPPRRCRCRRAAAAPPPQQLVIAAMRTHPDSPLVQQHGCGCLQNLATSSPHLEQLLEHGSVECILAVRAPLAYEYTADHTRARTMSTAAAYVRDSHRLGWGSRILCPCCNAAVLLARTTSSFPSFPTQAGLSLRARGRLNLSADASLVSLTSPPSPLLRARRPCARRWERRPCRRTARGHWRTWPHPPPASTASCR
jgi:hypothetical protein